MKPPTRPAPTIIAKEVAEKVGVSVGVAQGALMDTFRIPDGTPLGRTNLSEAQIIDKWELTGQQFRNLKTLGEAEARNIRNALTERAMIVAGLVTDELLTRLTDPVERNKIAARDLSNMLKHITDSAVTFQDGHAPGGAMAFDPMEMMRLLEERRAQRPVILPPPADAAS